MKFTLFKKLLFIAALSSLCILPNDANAWSIFGGEKKKLLEQANDTYGLAEKARMEGRANDAMAFLSDARGQYLSLLNTYPEYETELVTERLNTCNQQMKIIKEKIVSGEISVPTPEQVTAGLGSATTSAPIIFEEENPATKANEDGTIVDKTQSKKTQPELAENEPQTGNAYDQNSFYSSNNPLANANEQTCITLINGMIDSGKTTDAIFFIDEIIESKGDATPLSIRCLYVKALISVGNKTMATSQIEALKKAYPNDASVRSLIAALAIANGEPLTAMVQLDKIIKENPKYAEAHLNYAYLLLMMEPATYRDAAIDCYKLALKLGAKRDLILERNLNIVIK